ncbi:polymorphic toxin-type HINT domain-containing protein [Actinoplanes sp. NPDC026623]|uniref:polymorphic toxin-type HINT domain-containing protein n=1 Tax=Actinoplanes sp. NPDC026623 TaxID=3155610 RepID=UPI0034080398
MRAPFVRHRAHGARPPWYRPRRSTWWRHSARSAVAAVAAMILAISLGGSGSTAIPASADRRDAGRPHHAMAKPGQRWGSAAGETHLTGRSDNRTIPGTERGRFPLHRLNATPRPVPNKATVAKAPERKAAGFDRSTSRPVPPRNATERVYDNADGTQTTEFSADPLNFRRPDGSWAPIDTTLTPDGAGWRNSADSVDLRLAGRADSAELVRLSLDADHVFGYSLAGATATAGEHSGDTVTYPEVLPGVDLRLQARPGGDKETLVLRSAQARNVFDFPLRLTGLSARLSGRQVDLVDATGAVRAVLPAGSMQDSAAEPARSDAVGYALVDGGSVLRVTVDKDWLSAPERVFPVLADPSVGPPVDPGAADDSMYVRGGSSTRGTDELVVGRYQDANAAAYLRFDSVASRLANHTILGTGLSVINFDAASCRSKPVSVHPVTASWSATGDYSYPGPAVGGALATQSFAHGYIPTGSSSSACPAAAEFLDLGVAGRNLVQRWASGQPNYGLSLRASTSDSGAWKKFAGTGTANKPTLYVTHSPYNAKYEIPNPVPNPTVTQVQDGKVKITVTNLGADAWTPSTYYLAYRAYNATTGKSVLQQRAANLAGNVARGGKVTLDATIKALPPGVYFLDFTMVRTGGAVFTDFQVPPGRIVLHVIDIPPVVAELYPPNGYQAPTLTPLLWARAVDTDAPPGSSLQFKFEVCDVNDAGAPVSCTNSGYQGKQAWSVPAGRMLWGKSYQWRATVKDANNETPSVYSTIVAAVPQPDVISKIAGAPYADKGREFDAQVGNMSTAALDAVVATAGPDLSVARTYNSLDPRLDGAFGAGWSSRYDMKVVPDDDGSGNVVVNYPDGQAVRFGKNPDGTYAPPAGRTASLTVDSTSWKLLDKNGTTFTFSLTGKLTKLTDNSSHSLNLTYDTSNGRLAKIQVANSLTNTAGRALRFGWTGNHVTSVTTDAVGGTALIWSYTYTGDLLTSVCSPESKCTRYEYTAGSHYRTGVQDARPESYWRFDDTSASTGAVSGVGAASDVAINLGKDAGTYRNVTLGAPGALAGTTNGAASFNGSNSYVELPSGTLKKSRDAAVEVWFKIGLTQTGGPLVGYQDKAVGTAAGTGVPILYTGTDGRLRGQFAVGAIDPITSAGVVNNNVWHHAVLSLMGTTQTLYLDGEKAGERTGVTVDATLLTANQIGAASATTPASWSGWGSTAQRYFAGVIDEVAIYSHPLGKATAAAHWRMASPAAQQLSRVVLPSGRVASETVYDTDTDRVKEYTDGNGGTWKVGRPAVYGGDTDLRRSIQVNDPADRPYLYEYDALAGRMLRSGTPLGLEVRPEDLPRPSTPPTTPPPTQTCSQPDPQDPAFCTTIPDDSGGPVFVRHALDGMAIRTFSYNAEGYQNKVTNENGDSVEMTYDKRGNVTSRKTCRTQTVCYTSYSTYPTTITDPYDPRNDLATETRDGRSSSATDGNYLTTYSYHYTGQLAKQSNPDGSVVSHTYTNGAEAAVGGGNPPSGLLYTTTDARGKITRFAYFQNGDLAKVTDPMGLITEFAYDTLGRKTSEKQTSDAFPAGLTTSYTYDAQGRTTTVTAPATTDAVSNVRHQAKTVNTYDDDGDVLTTTVSDLLGGDAARTLTTEYDEYRRPVRQIDAEGNETVTGYDRFGNKTSMQEANGNRYDYAYTAQNKIAEIRLRDWHSDPAGAPATGTGDYLVLHSYSYDYAGRMASDTDSMGRRLEYQYYADDLLQRVVLKNFHDPNGSTRDYVTEETEYDGAGNPIKKTTGNGRQVVQNQVDKAGKVVTVTANPGTTQRVTTFVYDGNGNVTKTTRSGNPSNVPWSVAAVSERVDYGYDDGGNMIRQTVYDGTNTQVTTNTYDKRGLQTSTTDPRGNVSGADPAAYTTTIVNDELGRPTVVTGAPVATESNGQAPTTARPAGKTGFNTFGEQVSTADELGNVSRAEYDKAGRVVRTVAPTYTPPGAAEAVTPVTRNSYDAAGNVTETIDPDGSVTRFGYDQLNRLTVRDEPGRTNDDRAVSRFTYTRTGETLSVVGPTGARTESTYDDLDRAVTSTKVERYPVTDNFTTRITYDDAGNVVSTQSPGGATSVNTFDNQGQVTKTTSAHGVVTQFGYDYAGRQIRVTDGKGRTTRVGFDLFGNRTADSNLNAAGDTLRTQTYGYDPAGNMVRSTDPYQVSTTYTYDAANQLTRQVEPVTDTKSITTSWGYDAAGNRTRYTDGRGNSTVYTVNVLGLPESVVEPATTAHPALGDRTWSVAYNAVGEPAQATAPGGVGRTREYDAAGQLIKETGTGAESATVDRTLGYDPAGRLTSVSAPGGNDTYRYNDRGGVLSATGPSGNASFAYDPDGSMTSRTDLAGTATFAYDKGRLDTVKDAITGVTQKFGYDAAGMISTIGYGATAARTFGYDDYGRISSDTIRNPAGQTISSVAYGFDLNGHVTSKNTTGTAGAGQNSYGYDKAGRLTSWTSGTGTVAYEWDDSGNRVRAGPKTATFDERNRLLSDGDYTYAYTARGTLKSRTSSGFAEQFSFDAFDRMVGAAGQNYTYDGADRVATRNGARFTYGGSDDPVSDGTETFARGPGGEVLAVGQGQQARLTIADVHGDVIAVLDPTQTDPTKPASSTAYDPFGKVIANDGDTGNLGFQGDWTDPGTGKVDMGARWYEPGTGAFDSRDSANYSTGDSILANRYTYGAGAPLDYSDPDGHWPSWKSIKSHVSSAWNATTSVVSTAWNYTYSAARSGISSAWSAFKNSPLGHAASWVYHKTGLDRVVNKISEGVNAIRSGNFKDWAKQQARSAARHLEAARHAVTAAAKSAVKNAIKYTPIPALVAAAKPLIKGVGKVIESAAKLAPALVAMTVTAVTDPDKFVSTLYNKAVEQVGPLVESVSNAAAAVGQFVQEHSDAIIEGLAIVGGIAAGLACTAATAGAGAVACMVGAAALINLAKDAGQGNIHSFGDAFKSAAIGGAQGLLGAGAGAIGGRVAGAMVGRLGSAAGSIGGRMLSGGVAGGVSDAAFQFATTGHVDLGGVAMSAGIGAVAGGFARGGAGCRNSFAGTTGVLMADGTRKAISLVRVGDRVVATNPTTGRTRVKRVTDVIVGTGQKHLVEIKVDTRGGRDKIVATDEHPFWVANLKAWVNAKDLRSGYRFETADHRPATVRGIPRPWTAEATVYNLTVEGLHTYYVFAGVSPILVHNCGVVDAVRKEADAVADLPGSQRPNVIEALQIGDDAPIVRASDGGAGDRPIHPTIQGLLDDIPELERGNNHGGCGLVACLTDALNEGRDPTGASAAAVLGRARTNANFQKTIGPCKSCAVLVDHFHIDFKTG